MMASVLLILLLVAPLAAPFAHQDSRAAGVYTTCYSERDLAGYYFTFTEDQPVLSDASFDDVIDSVTQTGMWLYYEDENYDASLSGKVYWGHGIDYSFTFPVEYSDLTSSLRSAGDKAVLNADTWTVYDGTYFKGDTLTGSEEASSLGDMDGRASSMIVTGHANWTVYSETAFSGLHACVYSGQDHDHLGDQDFVLSVIPDLTTEGIFGNAIRSIRTGCHSNNTLFVPELTVQHRAANGAWGFFDL